MIGLFLIFVCSLALGWAGSKVEVMGTKMPFLLGSLVAGIALRHFPGVVQTDDLAYTTWSANLRTGALCVIMLRAGLALDLAALRRLRGPALRLASLPCLVEATVVACMAVACFAFTWGAALMLGFVVAAVSPAVVVPGLIALGDKGYGKAKVKHGQKKNYTTRTTHRFTLVVLVTLV